MENETVVTTLNLSKVCRACLMEYNEMHSIFSQVQQEDHLIEEPMYLCEILMNISSMKVLAEDGLPSMICTNCLELANTAYRFQQQCNRSQEILEAYLMQLQIKQANGEVILTRNNNSQVQLSCLTSTDSNQDCSLILQVATEDDTDQTTNRFIAKDVGNSHIMNVVLQDSSAKEQEYDLKEVSVKSETVHNLEECSIDDLDIIPDDIKTKIKDEILDAATVASSEDNVRLKERLALKRLKLDKTSVISNIGQPAVGFSYNVKMNEKNEKMYECNSCGKICKHMSTLKIHIRTHTLERPYVCSYCGKGFQQYGSLNYHQRSHTGEQPFVCKICGKKYRQSGTLTAHMRVHTGQKPFLCSVCGRGFRCMWAYEILANRDKCDG